MRAYLWIGGITLVAMLAVTIASGLLVDHDARLLLTVVILGFYGLGLVAVTLVQKLDQLHIQLNSRLDQLMLESRHAGELFGRAVERQERLIDPPPTPGAP